MPGGYDWSRFSKCHCQPHTISEWVSAEWSLTATCSSIPGAQLRPVIGLCQGCLAPCIELRYASARVNDFVAAASYCSVANKSAARGWSQSLLRHVPNGCQSPCMIKAAPSEVGSTGVDLSLSFISVSSTIRESYVNRRIGQVSIPSSPCPADEARVI